MNNSGLYILHEGFLCEVVSELDDAIIIEDNSKYILLPKTNYSVYTLNDLTQQQEPFKKGQNQL
jgi:hypothetical protein